MLLVWITIWMWWSAMYQTFAVILCSRDAALIECSVHACSLSCIRQPHVFMRAGTTQHIVCFESCMCVCAHTYVLVSDPCDQRTYMSIMIHEIHFCFCVLVRRSERFITWRQPEGFDMKLSDRRKWPVKDLMANRNYDKFAISTNPLITRA